MLKERLDEIRAELNTFEDDFMRYSFLVELSAYVNSDQPELMIEENLHKGCQSQVWIDFQIRNGLFFMNALSDTLIIRGILYIMMELFNGLSPKEITENRIDFLKELGLSQHFSDTRVSGIQGICDSVFTYCANIS